MAGRAPRRGPRLEPPPQEQDAPASREAWQNWLRDGLSARLGLSPDSVGLHTPFSSLGMGSATAVALTEGIAAGLRPSSARDPVL